MRVEDLVYPLPLGIDITALVEYVSPMWEACWPNVRNVNNHGALKLLMQEDLPVEFHHLGPLEVGLVFLFVSLPNSLGGIHKDGMRRYCAVNVPMEPTVAAASTMDWFDQDFKTQVDEKMTKRFAVDDEGKALRNPGTAFLSLRLAQPMLVNTEEWHSIDSRHNSGYRKVVSIRFKDNPTFQEARDQLQHYTSNRR